MRYLWGAFDSCLRLFTFVKFYLTAPMSFRHGDKQSQVRNNKLKIRSQFSIKEEIFDVLMNMMKFD